MISTGCTVTKGPVQSTWPQPASSNTWPFLVLAAVVLAIACIFYTLTRVVEALGAHGIVSIIQAIWAGVWGLVLLICIFFVPTIGEEILPIIAGLGGEAVLGAVKWWVSREEE